VVGIGVAVVMVDYARFYARYPVDDSFIVMRIARVWNDNGVPYFNHNEAVMGHSSHLWLWLVAAVFRVFGPRPEVVAWLSALCYVPCLVLAVQLLRRHTASPLAAVTLAAALVLLFLMPCSVVMMETPVAVAVMLGTLLLVDGEHDRALGFMAGLCLLARYELALMAVLCLAVTRRKRAFLVGAAAPTMVFVTFTLFYFHTLFPETAAAKRRVYSGGRPFLLTHFDWPLVRAPGLHAAAVGGFVLLAALLVWKTARLVRSPRVGWWPLLAGVFAVCLLALHVSQDGLMFYWYWPLITVPLMFAAIAVGLHQPRWWALPLGLALVMSPLTGEGLWSALGYALRTPVANEQFRATMRAEQYRRIARGLKESLPDGTMLSPEVGALGWEYYPNRIYDAVGLVTPAALQYHPMKVPEERRGGWLGAIPVGAVQDFHPDVVVAWNLVSEAFQRALEAGLLPEYEAAGQWPVLPDDLRQRYGVEGGSWGEETVDVYRRRP
jgi:hypothetical protein